MDRQVCFRNLKSLPNSDYGSSCGAAGLQSSVTAKKMDHIRSVKSPANLPGMFTAWTSWQSKLTKHSLQPMHYGNPFYSIVPVVSTK